MLTIEKLKVSEALKSLAPEVLQQIATLSQADEIATFETKIGVEIGKLHGQYDQDVLSTSGVERNQNEKSYDYVKRVITQFKGNQVSEEITSQLESLKAEKVNLEKQIKEGNTSEAVKLQLETLEAEKLTLTNTLLQEKNKHAEALVNKGLEFTKQRVSFEIDKSLKGITLNENVPESARKIIIDNAKAQIFDKLTPEFREIDSKQVLTFKDKESNQLVMGAEGFKSVSQILTDNLGDIVSKDAKANGSKAPDYKQNKTLLNLTSATTKVQADDIIRAQILESGVKYGTPEYSKKEDQLYSENKEHLSSLPTQ